MSKLGHLIRDLHEDQSGAAMIEYSVLLGVILAVTIGIIVAVGSWAGSKWVQLNTSLYNP